MHQPLQVPPEFFDKFSITEDDKVTQNRRVYHAMVNFADGKSDETKESILFCAAVSLIQTLDRLIRGPGQLHGSAEEKGHVGRDRRCLQC